MLLLFLVALLAGTLNAVAGGATFLVFPALMFAGVPPLSANVTASVALWPASAVTSFAYRRHFRAPRAVLVWLFAASVVGGLIGALTLLHTPIKAFTGLVPYLLLCASLIFTFGERVALRLRAHFRGNTGAAGEGPLPDTRAFSRTLLWAGLVQLAIGVYGGYFGAGMGILMLAELSVLGIGDIHVQNAVRSVLTLIINAVAVAIFVASAKVEWRPGLVMMAGAVTGGYGGAAVVRRAQAKWVRVFVLVIAWTMTAYFLIRGA